MNGLLGLLYGLLGLAIVIAILGIINTRPSQSWSGGARSACSAQ